MKSGMAALRAPAISEAAGLAPLPPFRFEFHTRSPAPAISSIVRPVATLRGSLSTIAARPDVAASSRSLISSQLRSSSLRRRPAPILTNAHRPVSF
jgi:hypothetical protein